MMYKIKIEDQEISCSIIRSARKSMAIEIRADRTLNIRVPYVVSDEQALMFLKEKKQWVVKHLKQLEENANSPEKTRLQENRDEIMKQWKGEKGREFLDGVTLWAQKMGVTFHRISIRDQKTRWGSCSSKGNLNFNWKLLGLPEKLRDYIIVHELAHRIEMNHSSRFWEIVEKWIPDYRELRNELKKW